LASARISFTNATPGGHRLAAAADGLDVHRLQAPGQALLLHQAADLVHLAAQAQDDDMGEIRVARIAGQRAAQQAQRLVLGHAAAGLMRYRNDTVDVGIIRQRIVAGERIAAEHVGHHAGDMGGAVHAGQDADIVASCDFPVWSADTLERCGGVEERRRLRIGAVSVILCEIAHLAVVHMYVLAGRDRGGGKADDLAVAAHRLMLGDGAHRGLVAGRNSLGGRDVVAEQGAGQQRHAGNHHVVVGMQANDGRWGHGCFLGMGSQNSTDQQALSAKPRRALVSGELERRGLVVACVILGGSW